MATNGLTWRILRDNESITRPGYIEIDLARIFRDDLYSDFSAFWLIAHHSRFPQDGRRRFGLRPGALAPARARAGRHRAR